jgi:hypothetical protein
MIRHPTSYTQNQYLQLFTSTTICELMALALAEQVTFSKRSLKARGVLSDNIFLHVKHFSVIENVFTLSDS